MAGILYLDSSAIVKLVLPEPETEALVRLLKNGPECATASIAAVEVVRAARRVSDDPAVEKRARQVLAGVHLLMIDEETIDEAAMVDPRKLRSLDALHVAAAKRLGADLDAMVVYDTALAAAAHESGIAVLAP